jgi:hypothetical protein
MTSLHDKIMNLPLGKGAQNWKADTLLFPYKCGHGDGINQAADLALQADALAEAAKRVLDAFDGDDQLERVDALAAMKACLGTETVPAVVTVERQRWSRIVERSIERHGDGGGQSWNGYVRGALRDVLREGAAEGQSGS